MTASTAQQPVRVLQAPPSLGLSTREAFRYEATALLDEMAEGNGRLVVDFAETSEVDSSGLSMLVMVHRHATERRQEIMLRGVGQELEFLLVLTKLDDLFLFAVDGDGGMRNEMRGEE